MTAEKWIKYVRGDEGRISVKLEMRLDELTRQATGLPLKRALALLALEQMDNYQSHTLKQIGAHLGVRMCTNTMRALEALNYAVEDGGGPLKWGITYEGLAVARTVRQSVEALANQVEEMKTKARK